MSLEKITRSIAQALNLRIWQVQNVLALFDDDASVPFIARYRKEQSGVLDEVVLTQIRDLYKQLQELEKRRAYILESIASQEKLTPQLQEKIEQAKTMTQLEDLYLPYKPKRKTRASMAKEQGLEPLAEIILQQKKVSFKELIPRFINEEKGVKDKKTALAGARDIIAEWISEDAFIRNKMRKLFHNEALVESRVVKTKKEEAVKFKDYFEWTEAVKKIPSHRFLAILRGNNEGFLRLSITPYTDDALEIMEDKYLKGDNRCTDEVEMAIEDCYKRLLKPSIETEIKKFYKEKADQEAIRVFAENLRELLLAAPLGEKSVLAIDPGFRTGCKMTCLSAQGKLLAYQTMFPFLNDAKKEEAKQKIQNYCTKYKVEAIAIGNGTAGRETMDFVKKCGLPKEVQLVMVNESGASIYSASEIAREEFPDLDLTYRGAVSIGRRLMDPLAELVKIDAKSIGVGQYQHDVQQDQLKHRLDDVVVSCVNAVGVEVNTASKELLSYVSGLGPKLAQNIIDYRNENGAFGTRAQLKKVKRLGPKAFEQAAGFLRIRDAKNPLDSSAVHPESYAVVKQMAKDQNCEVKDLMDNQSLTQKIQLRNYVNDQIGLPSLQDIIDELAKPGRDPRGQFENIEFREDVNSIDDLEIEMVLNGVITNVTNFGAFVDIGVHQDGLVHISQIANRFVKDPNDVVKVNQKVKVKVIDLDKDRKRINLSMREV